MGLSIYSFIQPDIEQKEWEKLYKESLFLLQKYPIPLLRYDFEEKEGIKRRVFTTDLVADKTTDNEHWYVFGDAISMKRAEDFRLYKNINYYKHQDYKPYTEHILKIAKEKRQYIDSINGVTVFDNKTQGYPYHFAILAAAILLENRLHGKAYIDGDIDINQAERTVEWMNSVLTEKVKMPLCCDADALYHCLADIYPDKTEMLQLSYSKYKGELNTWLETLLKYESFDTFLNFYAHRLAETIPGTLGASRLIVPIIQYVDDLEQLVLLVQKANAIQKNASTKPQEHTLESLLKTITNRFITFTAEQKEPLLFFTLSGHDLHTIDDAFTNLFMMFSGTPEFIDRYVSKEELLDIFAKHEPENRNIFSKIIEENEKDCNEQIAKTKEMIAEFEKQANSEHKEKQKQPKSENKNKQEITKLTATKQFTSEELYLIEQTYKQKTIFGDAEKAAKKMATDIDDILKKNKQKGDTHFLDLNEKELKKTIYNGSSKNGFGLTDSTWRNVDNETNIHILRPLAYIAASTNDSQNFWEWRYFFFENQQIWKFFVQDKEIEQKQL